MLKVIPEPFHALFIEFFNLYSSTHEEQQELRINLIMEKALSIEENLFIKRLGRVIARLRNTIIYRGMGLDVLFKSTDESPLTSAKRSDFVARCEELRSPGVELHDIQALADFLSVREGGDVLVPYKSFEHYANRIHASE